MRIQNIHALEILDSRGNPTIKTFVYLDSGEKSWSAVPSGASTGIHEAIDLRDGDKNRYQGKGVQKAVSFINNEINNNLTGLDPTNQLNIDNKLLELDGTQNKSNLGANTLLSVSQAVCRTAAVFQKKPLYQYISGIFDSPARSEYVLPCPMINIINGGKHAVFSCDIQEYMIIPKASTFSEALRRGVDVFQQLKNILHENGFAVTVGDEGGFAPSVHTNEEPLALILGAIQKANYQPGSDVFLGIDAAASEFFQDGKYNLKKENITLDAKQLTTLYGNWIGKYPLVLLEDIFEQDDWKAFSNFTKLFGNKIQVVGDDLFTTNENRLQEGIEKQAANAIIIKPNQIGTISETFKTIRLAQKSNVNAIISHRSGETEDDFIVDLAVGTGAKQIKTGSLCRSERMVKYNRLLEIEKELGEKAKFASAL
jgi:enolase